MFLLVYQERADLKFVVKRVKKISSIVIFKMAKVKRELVSIPMVKVHPNKIITYNEIHWFPNRPPRKDRDNQNSTLIQVATEHGIKLKRVPISFLKSSRTSNGELSKQAKKKLGLAIDYFLLLNRPQNGKSGHSGSHFNKQITFITLTLPSKQIHTDNEIKKQCLNQFLIEISKYNNVSMYVWRAEYQKNGNIHFHILANSYIVWTQIRNRWNRIIEKLGYISRYQEEQKEFHADGFKLRPELLKKWDATQQKKAYERGKRLNWRDPNSTDIHSIQNITNIQAYLVKYMTKIEQQKKEDDSPDCDKKKDIGRIWSASMILTNIKGATTEVDSELNNILNYLKENFPERIYSDTYFSVITFSIEELSQYKCRGLADMFNRYLFQQFGYSSQLTLT